MHSKPSKSSKKRDAQAVHALARRLLALNDEQLAGLPLDEELLAQVRKTRKISARSAARRERLYLARLMRHRDVDDLRTACDALEHAKLQDRRLFHQAERWRDRLLDSPIAALREFAELTGHPSERLAQLVGELDDDPPERVARQLGRKIFREIHSELAARVQRNAANV